ncbi:hypothetical protein DPMN_167867 [Dreissena polymorpha]|uniref:Uncharacterized protein n=1 Tax=Dreissena polymorpha TaxID=45954 RepID=A0A9D4IVE5_DREPO|nr:hypothetical protein DPMN_167867 [Dreissena polymorpha]
MFIFWLDCLGSTAPVEVNLWYVSTAINNSCAAHAHPISDIFCEFPQLFSEDRGRCEPFENVTCGDRFTPVTPCEYPNSNCSRPNGTHVPLCVCDPDRNINYDFCVNFNKSDGAYHWPGTVWSQSYLKCTKNRTIALQCDIHSEIFDHLREMCDSPKNIVQRAVESSQISDIPSSFLFLVSSIIWQKEEIAAKKTREDFSDVSIQRTQSMTFPSTPNVYPPDINQSKTSSKQTDVLSSDVGRVDPDSSDCNTSVLISTVNTNELTISLNAESSRLISSERTISGIDLVMELVNITYLSLRDSITTSVTFEPSARGSGTSSIRTVYLSSFQYIHHGNIMSSPIFEISLLPTSAQPSASTSMSLLPTVVMQQMPLRLTDTAIKSTIISNFTFRASTGDDALNSPGITHIERSSTHIYSSQNISQASSSHALSISHTHAPFLTTSPVNSALARTGSPFLHEPFSTLVVDTETYELTTLHNHTPYRQMYTSFILPITTSSTLSSLVNTLTSSSLVNTLTSLTSQVKEDLSSFDQNENSDNLLSVRITKILQIKSINAFISSATIVKSAFYERLFKSNADNIKETSSSTIKSTSFETIASSVSNLSTSINYVVENKTSKTYVISPKVTFSTDEAFDITSFTKLVISSLIIKPTRSLKELEATRETCLSEHSKDIAHVLKSSMTDISDCLHDTPDISSTHSNTYYQDTHTISSSTKATYSFRSTPTSAQMSLTPTTHLDTRTVQRSLVLQTLLILTTTFSTLKATPIYLETSKYYTNSLIIKQISQTDVKNEDSTIATNEKSFSPMPLMTPSLKVKRSITRKDYLLTNNINSTVAMKTAFISTSTAFSSVTGTVNNTLSENAFKDDKNNNALGITLFLSGTGCVLFVLVVACVVCVVRSKAAAAKKPISNLELSAEEWIPIPENKVIEFE